MTTRRLAICVGLLSGIGALLALRGQSQDFGGSTRPDEGPGIGGQEFPGPMMRGGPGGGFDGPGMSGGPLGPEGSLGPMHDPEVRKQFEREMKLHRQVGELARKCRQAGAKEKDVAKAELKKALGELFDVGLSNREHRAQKLQEEATRAREDVSNGRANRDKIVGRRLEQLTEAGGWEW